MLKVKILARMYSVLKIYPCVIIMVTTDSNREWFCVEGEDLGGDVFSVPDGLAPGVSQATDPRHPLQGPSA